MNLLFKICSAIVWVMAHLLGMTYEELNTVLFIYAEPAVLLFTALLLPIYMAYKVWKKATVLRIIVFVLSLAYVTPFIIACRKLWTQYNLSLHDNFVLAYQDLNHAAETTGLGYIKTVLLLFIGIFLVLLIVNFFLLYLERALFVDMTEKKIRAIVEKRKKVAQKEKEKEKSDKTEEKQHEDANKTAEDAEFPTEKR